MKKLILVLTVIMFATTTYAQAVVTEPKKVSAPAKVEKKKKLNLAPKPVVPMQCPLPADQDSKWYEQDWAKYVLAGLVGAGTALVIKNNLSN